jgi:hypothetical protein
MGERAAKAHWLAPRREVASYETHGRVCFAGGKGGRARWACFFTPRLGSGWEPLEYENLSFTRTADPRGTTAVDR